jgi:hypothetical protein
MPRGDTGTAAILKAADQVADIARGGRPFEPAAPALWRKLRFSRGYSAADTSEDGWERSVVVRLETRVPLRPPEEGGPSVAKAYNSLITNRLREDGDRPAPDLIAKYGWLRAFRMPLVEDVRGRVYMVIDLDEARALILGGGTTGPARKDRAPRGRVPRRSRSDVADAATAIDDIVRPLRVARRQGPRLSAEERRAIERRAVEVAMRHYRDEKWRVEEVRGRPYDLLCRRGRRVLHVEVKGTTSDGEEVLVTRNEVVHAQRHLPMVSLVVVSGISLDESSGRASGGSCRVLDPWDVSKGALQPIAYRYRLPPEASG